MADNEQISLSATEDRLAADKDGAIRKQLVDQLNAEAEKLSSEKNSGLSPDQFSNVDALVTAINEAIKVIELTWFKHHGSKATH